MPSFLLWIAIKILAIVVATPSTGECLEFVTLHFAVGMMVSSVSEPDVCSALQCFFLFLKHSSSLVDKNSRYFCLRHTQLSVGTNFM